MTAWMLLDAASILPEGLRFLKVGWWALHIASVVLIYVYGYRKGRKDERRDRQAPPKDAAEKR